MSESLAFLLEKALTGYYGSLEMRITARGRLEQAARLFLVECIAAKGQKSKEMLNFTFKDLGLLARRSGLSDQDWRDINTVYRFTTSSRNIVWGVNKLGELAKKYL